MMWLWRVIIVVPAEALDTANAFAASIDVGNTDGGPAFTVPLSASGTGPPSHFALYTSATNDMVSAMAAALPAIAGAMFWRHAADGTLAASNVTEPEGQQWGWSDSLAAAGLSVVRPPADSP
jgi:hypothetical protein